MSDMTHTQPPLTGPRHAARWTFAQGALAVLAGTFAVAITPLFFASMFMTVLALLESSPYGAWPWVVPLAAEGCFTALFLMDVVLVLRRKPRGRLRSAPYLFAGGSLVLQVLAGHGNPASITGHVMVTLAFFFTVIEGEESVRKLAVADKDARIAEMMADARRYAIDVVRDRRGRLWRWKVPALLRRDIITGRLCDEVRNAVELAVEVRRSSGWRHPVLDWVTRELRLSDEAEAADARARVAISDEASRSDFASSRGSLPVASGVVPPEVATGSASGVPTEVSPAVTPEVSPKRRRAALAKATDDQLADLVLPLFDGPGEVKKYNVIKAVREARGGMGVSDERAGRILELARRKRVVPIGERKRANA